MVLVILNEEGIPSMKEPNAIIILSNVNMMALQMEMQIHKIKLNYSIFFLCRTLLPQICCYLELYFRFKIVYYISI